MTAAELHSRKNASVEGEEGVCVCMCGFVQNETSVRICARTICTCIMVHLFHIDIYASSYTGQLLNEWLNNLGDKLRFLFAFLVQKLLPLVYRSTVHMKLSPGNG